MDATGWHDAGTWGSNAALTQEVASAPPPRAPRPPPAASCEVGYGIVVDRTGILYVPHTWDERWQAIAWLEDMLSPYPEGHYWRQVLVVRSAPRITRRRGGWGRPASMVGDASSGEPA